MQSLAQRKVVVQPTCKTQLYKQYISKAIIAEGN